MKHQTITVMAAALAALLAACGAPAPQEAETSGQEAAAEEESLAARTPSEEAAEDQPTGDSEPTAASERIIYPENWQDMPVVPVVSDRMREVYRRGLEMGNDPRVFSVIGDCQNVSSHFLAFYDTPGDYSLGEYVYLQETIDHFSGSFSSDRAAVRGGYNVASVLNPMMTNLALCEYGETPLGCEYRRSNPSIAIISMETNFDQKPGEKYATYMREIVEYSLAEGVVPILATKADNMEGDHSINAAIVEVAQEYDVPLWNFWASVQDLPDGGLTDGFHLTWARPFFDDPERMQNAWPIRNLTALQALDAVWRGVAEVDSDAEIASVGGG